ncbi:hypothetical protein DEU56DRAFT_850881 [Suillus clintonianus]|uniref:uncharacterized protein n=1 Tax=Suillus clintonianus TaxID=1904413 RepID=UPI001B873951|nr:uncharacterized protein DEU56DRAFT_850881 [Suillus clintonianus]KAG2150394.1 hypothetical protein DEU56DRAFT_850881 [Suillus clintonianus]
MQKFIPSVLWALGALFNGPAWLLRKAISIFNDWNKSPPTSDLPSYQLSPPRRPAVESYQTPSPLRPPPHRPSRRPLLPTQPTPFVSPDVVPVTAPRPHRSPTARAPDFDVAPVVIDPDEEPASLRLKARNEGEQMDKCFKESKEARAGNDRQRAGQLSQKGGAHKENMERLDKEASAKIFQENNRKHRSTNTVDLHRLYVQEALFYFNDAVQGGQDRGESSLRVIVGKGNHSENNIPKIKPAIQDRAGSLGLHVEVDPRNDGCLVVSLN